MITAEEWAMLRVEGDAEVAEFREAAAGAEEDSRPRDLLAEEAASDPRLLRALIHMAIMDPYGPATPELREAWTAACEPETKECP